MRCPVVYDLKMAAFADWYAQWHIEWHIEEWKRQKNIQSMKETMKIDQINKNLGKKGLAREILSKFNEKLIHQIDIQNVAAEKST